MLKRLLLGFTLALGLTAAHAQSVQQSGSVTPNTVGVWNGTGVMKGGALASDSPVTNFGVTRDAAEGICVSSARSSAAGRNTLCLQAGTTTAGKIILQNYGTAVAQDLQFVINGNTVTIPTGGSGFVQYSGALVSGNLPKWSGTSGLVIDSGIAIATGTQYGLAYYTASGAVGGIAAGTNGQIPVATTSGAPNWRTLSGDVSAVSAAGAVTLQSVNGVTYPSSYTANGVLYASSASAVTNVGTANVGYCLLSQGSSSAPIWAACASGSGSAGGSNTQVQFNNSSSLGGSANLTWSTPALTIGVAGSTTGQLALASSAGASGVVTMQAPTATAAYNFNLPTGAGSSGMPLLSGGGGATAMTFGALGVAGGGTGGVVASGTLLDNISGFSSTGYINRTGAGTYAFSTTIPVSGGGTNLASGTSGGILCFTGSGTIASSGALTANTVVIGGGAGVCPSTIAAGTNGQLLIATTGAAPAFTTMGTDATISAAGALTIANSAVTNAKMADAAAYTFKGNVTSGSAAVTDFTVASLTLKASPAAGDEIIIADNAASGATKRATVASVASAGSVSSIAGNTGAFTLTQPINNATNAIVLNAAITPQGRVTLTTATPVLTAATLAQTTVYYTPYLGNLVPIYDGTNIIPTAFAEVSQATTDATKSPAAATTNSNYDIFCWIDSGTNRCTRGPAWSSSTSRGTGAGTTELVRVSGLLLNANNITNGPNAQRGTYVGTIRTNGSSQVDWTPGAAASGGTAACLCIWNQYNRVTANATVTDSGVSYTTTSGVRQARASSGNQINILVGVQEETGTFTYASRSAFSANSGTTQGIAIGYDTTSSVASIASGISAEVSANASGNGLSRTISGTWQIPIGYHYVAALEFTSGNAETFDSASNNALTGSLNM